MLSSNLRRRREPAQQSLLPNVCRLDPTVDPDWDERIRHFPTATFFHSSAWSRVLRDTYGYAPEYFSAVSSERLSALLPLMEVDSWLTGRRGVGLPFTDDCGPLFSDIRSLQLVVEAATRHGRARNWKSIEYRGWDHPMEPALPTTGFHGHSLLLSPGVRSLWNALDDSVRRAVRKARKTQIRVEKRFDEESVRAFFELLCQTRRRHGLPPQPIRFFRNIHRHILARHQGCLFLAFDGGKPVAGVMFFHFGDHALYKFGGSDALYHPSRVNNLTMWHAIRWHTNQNFRLIDFGRTSLEQEGLRHYKLSWGTTERRIDYLKHDLRHEKFLCPQDAAFGWHNRVFRTLPIGLSRLIGTLLYRHAA